MPALNLKSLSFQYDSDARSVFQDLTLDLDLGEIVCIVGPSGCGKTTLLNLIAGFLKPQSGSIVQRWRGQGVPHRLGYIFQSDALLQWRTVGANIALAAELRGVRPKVVEAEILRQLADFRLEPSILAKYPSELSGGMRQRISLIQCLMADPELLLLDEPFSSLDFFTKLKLEGDIRQLVRHGERAALFVTHDIDEAIAIGDRVVVMGRSGNGWQAEIRIALEHRASLTPEEVRSHPQFGRYFAEVWKELRDAV
ncbi:MAG TPA: ABC transporter ATP-binding protein [Polyangiaceae bacterium]